MNWTDQDEVHECTEQLLCIGIGEGVVAEIEKIPLPSIKVKSKKVWTYRLTIGNLFGSQSLRYRTIEGALAALNLYYANGRKQLKLERYKAINGFIRAEDRKAKAA